jgi:hypothetical protein
LDFDINEGISDNELKDIDYLDNENESQEYQIGYFGKK